MKKFLTIISCGLLLLSATSVYAYQFDPSVWTNQDNYTLDLSVYDASLPTLSNVNQWGNSGWGYIDINDTDGSGTISAGDTFTDYNVYYLNGFKDAFNSDIANGGINSNYQMTVEAILTGTVTSTEGGTENFRFDSLVSANVYLDSANDINGLTLGSFGSAAGLADYLDSPSVLTGTSTVYGSIAGNNGYLAVGANGQGKYQVAIGVDEVSGYEGLLLDSLGINNLFDLYDAAAMYPDGDLTRVNPDEPAQLLVLKAFQDYYSLGPDNQSFIYTMSSQDGSIDLATIPEPATMMLFGIGLLGLAGITRRKNA